MSALLLAVLVASWVGSPHCAGMCGGIVAMVAGGGGRWKDSVRHQGIYHLGRLGSYLAIGLVSGAVGHAVDLGASAAGWERGAMIAAGALMLAVGISSALRLVGVPLGRLEAPAFAKRAFGRAVVQSKRMSPSHRSLVLGLGTGLLPCGWLYAFAIVAAGTGTPHLGAAAMAAFWAGSVPILAGLGLGLSAGLGSLRQHLPWLTALLLIGAGTWTVLGRVDVAGAIPRESQELERDQVPRSQGQWIEAVRDLPNQTAPCCAKDDGPGS